MRKLNLGSTMFGGKDKRRIAVIGNPEEAERVANLVRIINKKCEFIGLVNYNTETNNFQNNFQQLGHFQQIQDIINIYHINEIVFCSKDISADNIITMMTKLQDFQVEYKIAPKESESIIGSNSISTSHELYGIPVNSITKSGNRFKKRLFDLITAICLLLFIIIDIWFVQKKASFIGNIFKVIIGRKSWVGLHPIEGEKLPEIKPGVLYSTDAFKFNSLDNSIMHKVNVMYMQDYSLKNDINIIWCGFKNLGRQ